MPKYIVRQGEVKAEARTPGNMARVEFSYRADLVGTERGNPASADELHLVVMGDAEQTLFDAGVDFDDLSYEIRLDLASLQQFLNQEDS